MKRGSAALAAGIAVLAVVVVGVFLWRQWAKPEAPPPEIFSAPPAAAPSAPASAAAAPQYPEPVAAAVASTPQDVEHALVDLFGRDALSRFRLDDFPRRLAATVDNLGRAQASSSLWPVDPPAGRFTVEERSGTTFIGASNMQRYAPYVQLLERVDAERLVGFYAKVYPLVQRAYEELGYPKARFNDRLIAVIDELLATPEPSAPLPVQLPQIKGPLQLQRPWVLYQFADPALEALPAGQKLLLRMGLANERRVKAKLLEIRRLLVTPRPSR